MIASNEGFVIAAYAVTWIALLGYVLRLLRRDASARAGYARASAQGGDER